MMIDYKYTFLDWNEFHAWLLSHGFERYEQAMPCRRGYKKADIDIDVSYFTHIPNEVKNTGLKFIHPSEIPQELLKSWAV